MGCMRAIRLRCARSRRDSRDAAGVCVGRWHSRVKWRNQFIFNLALARFTQCGVELDPLYGVASGAER